jgi:AcrR family transcriptional regulator
MFFAPAPTRGRYQRGASQLEREAAQRDRLIAATVKALGETPERELTVADVVRRARVGRNTFYAHFYSLDQALDVARRVAASSLAEALDQMLSSHSADAPSLYGPELSMSTHEVLELSATDIARIVAHAWVETISKHAMLARALLGTAATASSAPVSRLGELLYDRTRRILEESVICTQRRVLLDDIALAIAASGEAFAKRLMTVEVSPGKVLVDSDAFKSRWCVVILSLLALPSRTLST